jgi:hypothetical protein
MTPKEKAKELVDFYLKLLSDVNPLNSYTKAAKTASQKCVDEIIALNERTKKEIKHRFNMDNWIKEWQEVKQEIENYE